MLRNPLRSPPLLVLSRRILRSPCHETLRNQRLRHTPGIRQIQCPHAGRQCALAGVCRRSPWCQLLRLIFILPSRVAFREPFLLAGKLLTWSHSGIGFNQRNPGDSQPRGDSSGSREVEQSGPRAAGRHLYPRTSNVLFAPDCNFLSVKRKRVFVEYFSGGHLRKRDAGIVRPAKWSRLALEVAETLPFPVPKG